LIIIPARPSKIGPPHLFYFVKITSSGNFWCPTPVYILQILFLGVLNDTLFIYKNKIVINSFSWGNKNYKIKSSHPPHIFW
jgi:hypothetical protein